MIALALVLALAGQPETEGKADFDQAMARFDVGAFEEALPLFIAAYQQSGHPELLFNIAQCHRNLGALERAIFFFERYLQSPKARDVAAVRALIDELEARLARAEVATATVTALDPHPPLPAPIDAAPPPEPEPALARRWWFWALLAAGTVAVAGAAWAGAEAARGPDDAVATLDYRDL